MPIDFPISPTTGQVYTYQGKSWIWNGTGWDVATPSFLPPFAAGNVIINGAFDIWQRGAGAYTGNVYTADRWFFYGQGSGVSHSATRQTFTPGSAPVAGYEGEFFYRDVITSGSDANSQMILVQRIEDVRTFAGQTVTMSFWAKANSGTPKIGVEMYQNFGSGGSGPVSGIGQSVTISTSWARYSLTFTVPSVSGKTIGTSSTLEALLWLSAGSSANTRSGSIGLQSNTFDIWGVQLEAGTVATPFRRNAPSIQAELAACQRYYQKSYNVDTTPGSVTDVGAVQFTGSTNGGGNTATPVPFRVQMRATPSMAFWTLGGTANAWDYERSGASGNLTAFPSGLGTSGLRVALSLGVGFTSCGAYGHWVATAEL
jgi:hypothetical protein